MRAKLILLWYMKKSSQIETQKKKNLSISTVALNRKKEFLLTCDIAMMSSNFSEHYIAAQAAISKQRSGDKLKQ